MNSLILQTATRILQPLMLMFSIYLLVRGHNDPGGGFVGGLVAATAFSLHALAYTPSSARDALIFRPHAIIGTGLLVTLASGLWSCVRGMPFLTGQWTEFQLPVLGSVKVGTPLLFDVGVYLVVLGVTMTIVLGLTEDSHGD
jgi:multicomponent Na+:H+ antiporter subunit B